MDTFTTRPDDPSSIPPTHMVEGKNSCGLSSYLQMLFTIHTIKFLKTGVNGCRLNRRILKSSKKNFPCTNIQIYLMSYLSCLQTRSFLFVQTRVFCNRSYWLGTVCSPERPQTCSIASKVLVLRCELL